MVLKCGHCVECCDPQPPRCFSDDLVPMSRCPLTSDAAAADEWFYTRPSLGQPQQQQQHQQQQHQHQHVDARYVGKSRRHFMQQQEASSVSSSARRVLYEYRSLHGSQNIMPSLIRQRRGKACLSLLQLPKKCTNVDPKRHKYVKPLNLSSTESIYMVNQSQSMVVDLPDASLQNLRCSERACPPACAPPPRAVDYGGASYCNSGTLRTVVEMNASGKRLREYQHHSHSHQKPFMTGSKVGISYFLNPDLSVSGDASHSSQWQRPRITHHQHQHHQQYKYKYSHASGQVPRYQHTKTNRWSQWENEGGIPKYNSSSNNKNSSKGSMLRSFSVSPPSVLQVHSEPFFPKDSFAAHSHRVFCAEEVGQGNNHAFLNNRTEWNY